MAARRKDNQSTLNFEIVGIIFISLSLLVFLCLIMPDAGALTRLLEKMLRAVTGQGRYIIPLLLAYFGVRLLQKRSKTSTPGRFGGGLLLFVAALGILHLFLSPGELWQRGLAGEGGGLIGALLSYILRGSLGLPGAVIVLLAAILVGLILTAEVPAAALLTPFRNGKNYSKTVKEWMVGYFFVDEEVPVARPVIIDNNLDHERHGESEHEGPEQEETDDKEVKNSQSLEGDSCLDIDQDGEENDGNGEGASPLRLVPRREFDGKGMAGGAVEVRSNMPRRHQSEYELPPFSLLSRPARGKIIGRASKDIADNIKILEETLENFGVRAKVTQVSRGPVITRYEIQPPAGVKVSRIVSLADDIALSMAAPDVRIEAPIPGKAALGIEVPNKVISMVHLRELLESKEFKEATSKLTVVLGRDIAGAPVLGDLTSMPHLLIAGATGSGKSVCLNTIISSILFRATPEQVKFLIIDPKMVELATYNGIPHLISPVVTEPKKAATSLRWAVKEMEYRYELFAAAGVRDINRYNSAAARDRRGLLPLLVVIIDELADLMMVAPADVEDSVCRLAQMARAAGMHLVVATQRPSVDVITGLIKANIPSRLSFAVSSQIDSRTILDTGGAEKLLGKGDMLFFPVGASKPVRLQGAFLSDREVEALVHYWKRQADPVYDESIISGDNGAGGTLAPEDELLPRAVEIFIETGHASISLLQRRLHIGYSRAARLIDIMEKKGIVGGYEGSKPRSVLITLEQFQQYFKDTRN